jgi:integrase
VPGKKPKYAPKGLYYRDERERFVYRWRDKSTGKYHRFSLDRKVQSWREASRIIEEHQENIRAQKLATLDPSLVTLESLKTVYTKHRAPLPLAAETKRRDAQALDSLMSVLGAGCLLRTISQAKIDKWAGTMLKTGTKTVTINSYIRHIKAALRWAAKTRVDDNDPLSPSILAAAPEISQFKEPQRLPRALTRKEAVKILWLEKNLQKRALWRFFLATGMRRQEAIDLDWRGVHLDAPEPYCVVIGKGNKERAIPLVPDAVKALERMPQMDFGKVWRFDLRKGSQPRPVKGQSLSKWFKAAARHAGIEDARLHDLRHTCATWLAIRQVPERAIQEILGHSTITVTQIYTKGYARISNLYRAITEQKVSPK